MVGRENEETGKARIYTEMNKRDTREFRKRCIDYGMTMSEVIRPAIEDFMRTHPPKIDRRPNID